MVFSSLLFVFLFLTLNLVCYYSVKTIRQKNIVLLVFSLIFYAWGGAAYLLLLAGMAFWSWLCALMIQKNEEQKTRKLWMWAECLVLLGLLIFFKYMNFLTGNLSALIGFPKEATKIILPIGISFYTFQLLSYVVDVERKLLHRKHIGSFFYTAAFSISVLQVRLYVIRQLQQKLMTER